MDKFANWYKQYRTEATWWIIGWLSMATFDCIVRGNYITALIDAGLLYFNYKIWKNP